MTIAFFQKTKLWYGEKGATFARPKRNSNDTTWPKVKLGLTLFQVGEAQAWILNQHKALEFN